MGVLSESQAHRPSFGAAFVVPRGRLDPRPHPRSGGHMHRNLLLEAEIVAERWAFLEADAREDYTAADEHYKRMDKLLEEFGRIPTQRPATP